MVLVLVLVLVLIYYSLVFEASWIWLLYRLTATRALDLGTSSRIGANLSLWWINDHTKALAGDLLHCFPGALIFCSRVTSFSVHEWRNRSYLWLKCVSFTLYWQFRVLSSVEYLRIRNGGNNICWSQNAKQSLVRRIVFQDVCLSDPPLSALYK